MAVRVVSRGKTVGPHAGRTELFTSGRSASCVWAPGRGVYRVRAPPGQSTWGPANLPQFTQTDTQAPLAPGKRVFYAPGHATANAPPREFAPLRYTRTDGLGMARASNRSSRHRQHGRAGAKRSFAAQTGETGRPAPGRAQRPLIAYGCNSLHSKWLRIRVRSPSVIEDGLSSNRPVS